MFAESEVPKPVERANNSKSPFLFVGLLDKGREKFVMGGKAKVSLGNKGHGLSAAKYCRFVTSYFQPGNLKWYPTSCQLAESSLSSQP
jgi:hypothetical protein